MSTFFFPAPRLFPLGSGPCRAVCHPHESLPTSRLPQRASSCEAEDFLALVAGRLSRRQPVYAERTQCAATGVKVLPGSGDFRSQGSISTQL